MHKFYINHQITVHQCTLSPYINHRNSKTGLLISEINQKRSFVGKLIFPGKFHYKTRPSILLSGSYLICRDNEKMLSITQPVHLVIAIFVNLHIVRVYFDKDNLQSTYMEMYYFGIMLRRQRLLPQKAKKNCTTLHATAKTQQRHFLRQLYGSIFLKFRKQIV